MAKFNLSKTFTWQGTFTDKVAQVCRVFGLTEDDVRDKHITHRCSVEINEGDIVCITGPSGSGKSVLIRELENCIPADQRVSLRQIPTPRDKTVIDCIDGDMLSTLRIISIAGLNDTFCVLNQPSNLSEGQKWRYRLAVALSSKKKYIFADEFCSNLDRLVSSTISYKVWQFARKTGVTFIVAASSRDILSDLGPDVVIVKSKYSPTEVIYNRARR